MGLYSMIFLLVMISMRHGWGMCTNYPYIHTALLAGLNVTETCKNG